MKESILKIKDHNGKDIPVKHVHTLVIGSGAAALNAAVQLVANGIEDIVVLTEGLHMGTSINAGSDKQTYYKLSMCGEDADAPMLMARNYFEGGGMHGDVALVEASLSARSFMNLVNLGVPFPRDAFGQFIGYKTDHDPRQRATSIGPYTSREMCRALIKQVKKLNIPVLEDRNAVELLMDDRNGQKRAVGAVVLAGDDGFEVIAAQNVVFGVGGPGGIYKTSVYPEVHTGAGGLAMMAGAICQGLPESQYGMASIKYRWNVSGTYMQVIPRFISTDADGVTDEREFMPDYFDTPGEMNSMVFLKGYQWPFDSRKVIGGSSIIDLIVYIETVLKGRRVFLDFRRNPEGFKIEDLSDEARTYLEKSEALQALPIERLEKMNPGAIELYLDHDIDIRQESLEIAVCAQHNNGGIAANHWWESVNIKHLFPVGEVNGAHGVYRPGGASLNAGQVGSLRAAEYIANRYAEYGVSDKDIETTACDALEKLIGWVTSSTNEKNWVDERNEFQERMSRAGAHIRVRETLITALQEARHQVRRIEEGCGRLRGNDDLRESLRNRHLAQAHVLYLEAVLYAVQSGAGSRGSAMVVDEQGIQVHEKLGVEWKLQPENLGFREKVQETCLKPDGLIENRWVQRRPIPESDVWFETAWARFRSGEIYDD